MEMHVPIVSTQLGSQIADFPWNSRARGARWLLIGLLVGGGLLLIALGRQAVPRVAPIILGLGALLLLIGLGAAYVSLRHGTHSPQLALYEQGIMVQRGRKMNIVRYDEIDTLREQILWHNGRGQLLLPTRTHVYTIQTRDRRTLRLSDQFVDVRQAGALLQREVLRRRRPAALAAYQEGTALPFGALTISRDGLTRGKATLPWAEVVRVGVTEGSYRGTAAQTYKLQVARLGQRRPWLQIDLEQIPNSRVLLALLKELGVTLDLGPLLSLD